MIVSMKRYLLAIRAKMFNGYLAYVHFQTLSFWNHRDSQGDTQFVAVETQELKVHTIRDDPIYGRCGALRDQIFSLLTDSHWVEVSLRI